MELTERQKKFLRTAAHSLKPVVTIGDKGLSDAVLAELDAALTHHELLKVKLRVGDRMVRDELLTELCERSRATLISRIGNTAVVFRQRKKKPGIVLPQRGAA